MRLIFVNHAHPQLPHVSGTRLASFAAALARRGHRVVLLAAAQPRHRAAATPNITGTIASHDWATPLIVALLPLPTFITARLSSVASFSTIRRITTLWRLLYHGGVHEDWVAATQAAQDVLCSEFRPDLVWGTFGNTSNLVVAQTIGRKAGCPWVMDIKDNWNTFVPYGLRTLLAKRFSDAAGFTSNSVHHRAIAESYFNHTCNQVVYSGVADSFFRRPAHITRRVWHDITLVGGTYRSSVLKSFLRGLKAWLHTIPHYDLQRIRFVYAGSDQHDVSSALAEARMPIETEVAGYLSLSEFADMCQAAWANCYLWAPFTFHHKLLELLSCGRPVIAYPGESIESAALAMQIPTPFFMCRDDGALHGALTKAWDKRSQQVPLSLTTVDPWRWCNLAKQLEGFFVSVS